MLLAGIGAQERALRQLGIPYEIINTCDCDKDAVLSYAAMRFDLEEEIKTFDFPSKEQMIEELQAKNLGFDFEHKQVHTINMRMNENKVKRYYLADKLSKNLGDISQVKRLPYADIVTYSFPCTDISLSGKGEGMANRCECGYSWPIDFSDSNEVLICPQCGKIVSRSTRSGLLGQVQRLLTVAKEEGTLPKYLLLENVKNLTGKKFIGQFTDWINWLDSIGYTTFWEILNAKNFGIPQNRERVFAVSIRKDINNNFTFPEEIPLTIRLKDVLEKNVDEKYYLPDERVEKILDAAFIKEKKIQSGGIKLKDKGGTFDGFTDIAGTLMARDYKGFGNQSMTGAIEADINVVGNYMPSNHDASRVVDIDGIAPTVKENHGTVTAIAEPQVRKVGQASNEGSQCGMVYSTDDLSPTLTAGCHGYAMGYIAEEQEPFVVASRGRNPDNPSDRTTGCPTEQRLEPNFSGCTNTITSVQKDNYVCEPIVYDDYNSNIPKDQDAITTLTTNCGAAAERNGVKIIEQFYKNREPRIYDEAAPTLRSERSGLEVAESFPCSTRGKQIASALRASVYKQGSRNIEENVVNGLGYEGVVEKIYDVYWRIRKLTTKECLRLMGFTDSDADKSAQYVSASAQYKQAGNSICTCCLVALFSSLFIENGHKANIWSKYLINFNS